MNPKVHQAFILVSNYLESKNISQDSFSLEERITFWDNEISYLTVKQLAAIAMINPSPKLYFSNSYLEEISYSAFAD